MEEYLIVLVVVVVAASWILVVDRWSQKKRKQGPKTWPLVGATVEAVMNFHRLHDWMFDYLSKSKTVAVPFVIGPDHTYTADPANVEHILKIKFSNYPKGENFHAIMEPMLGDGIFNVDGEAWKRQRKTASFEFSSKNLRDFSTVVFRDYTLKLSSILAVEASSNGKIVDMQDLLMRMSLDSICKVGFGVEIGTLAPDLPKVSFAEAFDAANLIVTHRFFDPFWKIKNTLNIGSESHITKNIKVIDEFTYPIINRRKSEIIHNSHNNNDNIKIKQDLLSRFIEMRSDLSNKSLRDAVLNFVIAGRDTTAVTISWAIHMIMSHPRVSDKLYAELKALDNDHAGEEKAESFEMKVARFAGLLTYESLGKLHYLHAVITETLRLYPAVPIDAKGIVEDDVLPDGTEVKAGGMIFYSPYSMGRAEYNWGPDASTFNPERWLKDGVFQNESPFKFTAFQAGPRICLGKDSAYLQMKMALAILCRFFEFKLVPGHVVEYQMMVILSMANGLKVTVSIRDY